VRSLFLRALAVIYLIAFASLLPQLGLISTSGILPAQDFLQGMRSEYGGSAYLLFPTLAWINSSDAFLKVLVWSGIVLAVLLFLRVVPLAAAIGLYVLYLSIDTVGQTFYSFQWDALLLETGFAAILLTPVGLRPSYKLPPPKAAIWLFRFLIFKLMFESGAVKLLSGDPAWRGLSALTYHYETQPLPTAIAWYVHQLPALFQKISVVGVFVIELIVPWFFFATRRLRVIAAWATIAFQLLIALTGNYTFFNLLTMALCVPLFEREMERTHWLVKIAAVMLIALSVIQVVAMFRIVPKLPEPISSIEFRAQTLYVVNRYGLFAVMTTDRKEIVIEGSDDGNDWKVYDFKYKPGDVNGGLHWVAPYQPRLDWQMWFAALSDSQDNPWFQQLLLRLLEGRPEVTSLLASNPFPDAPPRFIRAVTYDYHFSDWATRRKTGAIWTRTPAGDYFPVVSLRR